MTLTFDTLITSLTHLFERLNHFETYGFNNFVKCIIIFFSWGEGGGGAGVGIGDSCKQTRRCDQNKRK